MRNLKARLKAAAAIALAAFTVVTSLALPQSAEMAEAATPLRGAVGEENRDADKRPQVEIGKEYETIIDSTNGDGRQYYKFRTPSGTKDQDYVVTLKYVGGNVKKYIDFRVYGDAYEEDYLFGMNIADAGGADMNYGSTTLKPDTTYYLSIYEGGGLTGDETEEIFFTIDKVYDPSEIGQDETSSDDTGETKQPVVYPDTPYCDSLNLNYKSGSTITNTATATYYDEAYLPKKKNVKVKQTIKTTTKESGDNYKTTFKITYDYKGNPKIQKKSVDLVDWSSINPFQVWESIDYRTGKIDQIDGVTYSDATWKSKYYKKQNWKYSKKAIKKMKSYGWNTKGITGSYMQNLKKETCTFTVTYPKTEKNLIIAIGTYNLEMDSGMVAYDDYIYGAWNPFEQGEVTWDQTIGYKSGNNFVYIRLNQ